MRLLFCFALLVLIGAIPAIGGETSRMLDGKLHHLRREGPREWTEFPEKPEAAAWDVRFHSEANPEEWAIGLRQQDVKRNWSVLLNGKDLGQLIIDENDMRIYFPVPKGALIGGENHLRIEQKPSQRATPPDDIRVGEIELIKRPLSRFLNEASLEIEVDDQETGRGIPARITIVSSEGTLQTTGAASNNHLAVRPGLIYTATGRAKVGLPEGRYKVYAGRGFEYSLAASEVPLNTGDARKIKLTIRREVPTAGYVACDTHVHTLTHSGHGDATVQERMITLAAEGVELPIAADHNVHIDHRPFAAEMKVAEYFTPVMGNEVTTPVGHFNIFPIAPGAKVPNHKLNDWGAILNEIHKTPGVKVAILNHARDLHSGVRPFGPKRFNEAVGENVDGWPMRFNAMEVINSGATQSDPFQLFEDWMALLNRGQQITPIGGSDSHDVARHFVGQGRTYIRANDQDPSRIDVNEAVDNLLNGQVMVSYGLLVKLTVEEKYTSGELARLPNDEVRITLQVFGPHWVEATELRLYSNGELIREFVIPAERLRDLSGGLLWEENLTLPKPKHDVHLVAIATGPGITESYWKTAKPYQPTSADWRPHVIGCSGAVWLDGDGDGRRMAARDYAQAAHAKSLGDFSKLVELLADYDAAVSAQAAHLYQSSGGLLESSDVQNALQQSSENIKRGFQTYQAAWRETQIAKSQLEE